MKKLRIGVELTLNEQGKVLWFKRYIFKRLHFPNDTFIRDNITYQVISHTLERDKELALITCVVKVIS